jgi:dolichol-phosphate mannosyltransferase
VKLSIVMPAHDEAEVIAETLSRLTANLHSEGLDYEILVVDDGSTDGTSAVVAEIAAGDERMRCFRNAAPNGFGRAVRAGLAAYTGDAVVIAMADGSDDPRDVVLYYRVLEAGYDCAFGSRFMPGAEIKGYPRLKLAVNRVVNHGIRLVFRHGYNDTTNAFKAYKREVIEQMQPLISPHFNLTVEMPLKAVTRGFSYAIVPTSWTNRRAGASDLGLREMGSRYLFIVLYVFLEAHLSRGDYKRAAPVEAARPGDDARHRLRRLRTSGRR